MPLLQTKLYVPPLRAQRVQRDDLIDRLLVDDGRRLTLISAPAGFGKTTLVSAWVAQSNYPVAWLSLDDDDNDPTRFLSYLIAALQAHLENIGANALGLLASPQPPPFKTILTLLLNDLGTLTTSLALILDDYHVITSPQLHEAVIFLLDHLPPRLRLVITTRMDPPFPLARWRVRDQLVEVRADDLRFSVAEAATFLNDVMGLSLSNAEIRALDARAEGWIAGLQLAALSLQGRADATTFIAAFSGGHRHVLSYLVEEVLNRCSKEMLDFLLWTSILEHLTAPLCDTVTARSDSLKLLRALEQGNFFLIPLDDEGAWYRYHHLFAEVLRTHLHQTHPALIPQLHQRATTWYAVAGPIEHAVAHALAIPDVEQAATLVEGVALTALMQQSEVLLVRRLVERLPLTLVYQRPYLILAYGLTLALSGQFDAVQPLLLQAAPILNSPDLPGDVAGGLAVLHSTLARFRGDLDQSLAFAQQALHKLPADAQALRALAALNMGSVALHRLDRLTAGQALADAVTWGTAAGADYTVLAAVEELATEQIRQGQLAQARQSCEQGLTRVTGKNKPLAPAAGLLLVILGEVLVEHNELARATQVLTQGLQLLQATTEMGLLARGYCALARCHWAGGERESAFTTLHQGEAWLSQIPSAAPGTYARLAAQQARLHVWQGDLAAARAWEQEVRPLGLTLLGYFQHLTCVRIRLAQYAGDPQPSLLVEASDILTPLLVSAEQVEWGSHILEILLLQALIEEAQGQRAAARTILLHAILLAEASGYTRLFVDEGAAMQRLLSELRLWLARERDLEGQPKLLLYVDKLLKLFSVDQQPAEQGMVAVQPALQSPALARHYALEPLSARELEVLQLLAAGLSNAQIAAQLIVTTATVKTHINHIFSKLAVDSRIQATVRARELGLLAN